MKFAIQSQIAAVQTACDKAPAGSLAYKPALEAALATLKWVERHQAELRVLGEFPIEKIEVKDLVHADGSAPATDGESHRHD
jgi:hypothetical protein